MTWTPDGRHLTFNRRIKAPETTIEWIDPSGSEKSTVLVRKPHFVAGGAWSPDGKVLAFFEALPATQRDLSVLEPGGDRQSRPFLVTPANERGPRFSPNGRWIAYVSDTSGRDEVFMNAFPGPSGAIPVSTGGGREPVWSRDGRELFYRQGDRLMTVSVDDAASPSLRSPRLLFEGPYQTDTMVGLPNYDVAPDGRFIMVSDPRGPPITRFTIVQNWFEELKRRVPPGRP
jgi:serine/threonine-protein kinase